MKTLYILVASFFFCLNSGVVMAQQGAQQTPKECVTGDAVAKNIIYKVNGKTVSTLQGNVKEGNLVEVTFTTAAGTKPTRFSLVTYNAASKNASKAEENEAFDYETEEVTAGTHTMSVTVPNNYFQVNFVKGCIIWKFDANNTYGARSMSQANGGEKDCCKKCDDNKKVTICHVPKGNPANAHTITIAKQAAKAHVGRHGGDYYGECKPTTGGNDTTSTVTVDVTCDMVNVSSSKTNIKFITLVFDGEETQTFEIDAKTASVSPNEVYEGYFIKGAYVKVAKDGSGAEGTYYENANFAECEELIDPSLPVKMIKFEAKKIEQNVVKLEWATASESNSEYIAIEKSSDIENWKEVCKVPSAGVNGNSQHVHDYSCTDEHASEDGQNIVYYRPKQVDLNGTFEYHNTIKVRLMDAAYATQIESVYPNPATDRLSIKYNAAENSTFSIKLTSLDGKSLLQNNYVSKPGVQTIDLDLLEDKLKPGIYVLEIQTDKEMFRQKVYKQ
ncbi:MAG: T9SS type A sorting domain-containing protein [Sphingobacteriales bacterium]|nr:MAG: T9SS type A sorting domain-containing protein [Sphingobacteriales bacterium]